MPRPFFDWINEKHRKRIWLLLGQGPTFDRYLSFDKDRRGWETLGLNKVCTVVKVGMTHIADWHNVEEIGQMLLDNSGTVVMPWYPHVDSRPGPRPLDELARKNELLRELDAEGRLLAYNSKLAWKRPKAPADIGPTVPVRFFSAVAAVALLGMAGVKTIRTLGIDGGFGYSELFDKKNLGLNGRKSFDVQTPEIRKLCKRFNINYSSLA